MATTTLSPEEGPTSESPSPSDLEALIEEARRRQRRRRLGIALVLVGAGATAAVYFGAISGDHSTQGAALPQADTCA